MGGGVCLVWGGFSLVQGDSPWSRGVLPDGGGLPGLGGSAWSGGVLPGPGGFSLVPGGVLLGPLVRLRGGSPWSRGVLLVRLREGSPCWGGGCVCLVWGVLPGQGVSAWSRGVLPGGVSAWSGGVLQRPPPVNRITDTCKNITLATTSLRPVIMMYYETTPISPAKPGKSFNTRSAEMRVKSIFSVLYGLVHVG